MTIRVEEPRKVTEVVSSRGDQIFPVRSHHIPAEANHYGCSKTKKEMAISSTCMS